MGLPMQATGQSRLAFRFAGRQDFWPAISKCLGLSHFSSPCRFGTASIRVPFTADRCYDSNDNGNGLVQLSAPRPVLPRGARQHAWGWRPREHRPDEASFWRAGESCTGASFCTSSGSSSTSGSKAEVAQQAKGTSSGSGGGGNGEKPNGASNPNGVSKDRWADAMWNAAVGCQGSRLFHMPMPADTSVQGALKAWLWKKLAIRHVRSVAPVARAEGRFETLEADFAEAVPQCLRVLAEGLEAAAEGGPRNMTMLQPPMVEMVLADQLEELVTTLRSNGRIWRWELGNALSTDLERVFIIFGSSRTGTTRRGPTDILYAFGQQFVFTRDQLNKFVDTNAGLGPRISVMQELVFADLILVADVRVKVVQRSLLEDAAKAEKSEIPPEREVEHVLRMESQFTLERGFQEGDDQVPQMRCSPWQIADWNGICDGNHPSIPRGYPSPW